ncbi:ABC transporter permease [Virgibacillus siamensis]|uniref:ABC transporter permease n=1 Tax=Virgibacillus siamensis TaxID=480071 RepID=UPI00098790C9|nr:ABC transporter permease [Virgibacillus siamensis]
MIGIFLAKVKMFLRHPWTFVIMIIMSVGFALILGSGNPATVTVPVHTADDSIRDSTIGEMLEQSGAYSFEWVSEDRVKEQVTNGNAEVGLILRKNDYDVIVGVSTANAKLVEQKVYEAYSKKAQYHQIAAAADSTGSSGRTEVLAQLKTTMDNPIFDMDSSYFTGSKADAFDMKYHTLFGFTLFFVIYTIAYNVFYVLLEKKEGIWDRVILSPVRKWEMYTANFVYTFLTGYLQVIVVFLVFRYLVGVDFNGRFLESLLLVLPYVFSIVALSILITGIVKTVQQFNAVIPILAVSMAMIGGAYWPIEIVESKIMLMLSKIDPITYGMEILYGVAIYDRPLDQLLSPISILLLMGVLMTGIGIHLMERRYVS